MKHDKIYNTVISVFLKKTFSLWQSLGFHITPNHFYEPIPDTRELDASIWERNTEMKGIEMNVEKQIEFLDIVCKKYKNEYDNLPLNKPDAACRYFVYNGGFGEIDGDILYCMIRKNRPKRIIEIGSGWSTYLSAYATEKNRMEHGIEAELIAIEPFPNNVLKQGFKGLSRLIDKKVQNVDLKFFESLNENDILFIDSTHVAKINSDVCYEYLEILPRLKKGVLIHIHDIFLPEEYPRDFIMNRKYFWNEQYLLQAFLMFNQAFEVIWAGNYMRSNFQEKCQEMFRSRASQSFWIRKK